MELPEFRTALDAWLDEHEAELTPPDTNSLSLEEHLSQVARVKRITFDAGWMRWGWPERVGGLGGSSILRAYLGDALTARDLVDPGAYSMTEVLAPTMIDYAPEALAKVMVPRLLREKSCGVRGFPSPAPVAIWRPCSAGPPVPMKAGG